jgi:hypothetical protein
MYSVVSDVSSYALFLPYCLESRITARDGADVPKAAILRVGWKEFDETFESKLAFSPTTVEVSNLYWPETCSLVALYALRWCTNDRQRLRIIIYSKGSTPNGQLPR